jgi:protein involved in polysaccharide export with SLBB domain
MDQSNPIACRPTPRRGLKPRASWIALLLLLSGACGGCAAVTNPIADGIPVRLLPPELLGPCKTTYQTIPLNVLRQPEPDAYKLDVGDVLGVYVEGYLGEKNVVLPVQVAPLMHIPGQNRLTPGVGYPIPVQEDGNIALPAVPKLSVKGMTLGEAREAISKLYEDKQLKVNDRILVSLLHPRQHQVLVFRQEAQSFLAGQDGPIPISKRNTGHLVDLPAYHNDVLNALVRTGGLPELDAFNEIIIYRDGLRDKDQKLALMQNLEQKKPGSVASQLGIWIGDTIRIPLRMPAGAPLPFSRDDIVLRGGDVVFLEARDEQAFFTGGLLPPGKHMLPRDHDLDAIEAVTMVRGPFYNGAFGGSNLSGALLQSGLGSPSPSLLVVLRKIPGRGQVPIVVDLRNALRYPQERLVIRPGDMLVLQEKPGEALARYASQTFLNFEMMLNLFHSSSGVGVLDVAAPDRLSTRPGIFNVNP